MAFKTSVNIPNPSGSIKQIAGNNKARLFLAETCGRYFNPYVPMQSGTLSQNYTTEPGKLTYNQPYAKKMYYGKGLNFSKEQHPLSTSYWDKVCYSANKNRIVNEVSAFINRG